MKSSTTFHVDATTLMVGSWPDELVESLGFGPRSSYVELCWLGVLGPTSTWLYRRLAVPLLGVDEYLVDLVDLSVSLGLGEGIGRHSRLMRSLGRLMAFDAARWSGDALLVRRALAPLTVHQAQRLSTSVRLAHERLMAQ